MSKQYFCPDLGCDACTFPISDILAFIKKNNISEVHINKPKRIIGKGVFFCDTAGGFGISGCNEIDTVCGKCCKCYIPRNGKSGCCKHRQFCYEAGEEFILHSNGVLTK